MPASQITHAHLSCNLTVLFAICDRIVEQLDTKELDDACSFLGAPPGLVHWASTWQMRGFLLETSVWILEEPYYLIWLTENFFKSRVAAMQKLPGCEIETHQPCDETAFDDDIYTESLEIVDDEGHWPDTVFELRG